MLKTLIEFCSGTPNSGTTSLSALSTTAIKDGHQGHALPHDHMYRGSTSTPSNNTLEAERADRISRLAGLERVATLRGTPSQPQMVGALGQPPHQSHSYFDPGSQQQEVERSTVGSASATGSAGGKRTWASGSEAYDADKLSEDHDDGVSSTGMSDEGNASLVGFGETASSTISGPTSTPLRTPTGQRMPVLGASPPTSRQRKREDGSPMEDVQRNDPSK